MIEDNPRGCFRDGGPRMMAVGFIFGFTFLVFFSSLLALGLYLFLLRLAVGLFLLFDSSPILFSAVGLCAFNLHLCSSALSSTSESYLIEGIGLS